MTTQREIQELFNKIAFPETPEERDDAEQAVINLLAEAWEEGYQAEDASIDDNPYTSDAQVTGL